MYYKPSFTPKLLNHNYLTPYIKSLEQDWHMQYQHLVYS